MEELINQAVSATPIVAGMVAAGVLGAFLAVAGKIQCRELACFNKVGTPNPSLFFWYRDRV